MKKTVFFLCFVLLVSLLAGCSSNESVSTTMTTKEMSDKIQESFPLAMPGEVDNDMLRDLFYVNTDLVEEHTSVMSFANISADNLVIVKAQSGKASEVAEGLNKRLEDVRASFERYLPDQYDKAKAGKVITKGDYVFLVILGGEDSENFAEDMVSVEGLIDGFFQ